MPSQHPITSSPHALPLPTSCLPPLTSCLPPLTCGPRRPSLCCHAERWLSKDHKPGVSQDRPVLRAEKIRVQTEIRLPAGQLQLQPAAACYCYCLWAVMLQPAATCCCHCSGQSHYRYPSATGYCHRGGGHGQLQQQLLLVCRSPLELTVGLIVSLCSSGHGSYSHMRLFIQIPVPGIIMVAVSVFVFSGD